MQVMQCFCIFYPILINPLYSYNLRHVHVKCEFFLSFYFFICKEKTSAWNNTLWNHEILWWLDIHGISVYFSSINNIFIIKTNYKFFRSIFPFVDMTEFHKIMSKKKKFKQPRKIEPTNLYDFTVHIIKVQSVFFSKLKYV